MDMVHYADQSFCLLDDDANKDYKEVEDRYLGMHHCCPYYCHIIHFGAISSMQTYRGELESALEEGQGVVLAAENSDKNHIHHDW
jgi:hypothetical protein